MEWILASASPRRQELCQRLGIPVTVIPAQSETAPDPALPPETAVRRVAQDKAREVFAAHPDAAVLGADTVVAVPEGDAERLLGKPRDAEQAAAMLRRLQGTTHRVLTGVCLCGPFGEESFTAAASVTFYPMTEAEIAAYVATGEPMDKAGAYGIQGFGMRYIEGIDGDYYTVMGLPAARCWQLFEKFKDFSK